MSIIGFTFVIDTDKHVLWLDTSHYTLEQAGFAGAIPSEHTSDIPSLGCQIGTLKNLVLPELKMNTIYEQCIFLI